jgi:hypothetical protein
MSGITTYLSILTLNTNGINSPIKRHKMDGWRKIYQTNGSWKQVGVAKLTWDKVDFQPKLLRRDKEGHCTLIKGAIHQEATTVINLYALNVSVPNFNEHTIMDLKSQIDPNIVLEGDFNIPLSPIDRSSRQKNQRRNSRTEWHHTSNGTDRCLQSIPSCNTHIHSSQQPIELSPK